MQIRRIEKNDLAQVKDLWKEAFPEDGEAYLNWYFREVYNPMRSFGVFANGVLISMATLAEYQLYLRGAVLDANFFQGVATKKEFQGQGYAGKLMEYMLQSLYQEGAIIASLNTYIHPFYRKYGFETYVYTEKKELLASKKGSYQCYSHMDAIPQDVIQKMCLLYRAYTKGFNGYIVRLECDFQRLLYENIYFSGYQLLLDEDGYAVVKNDGQSVLVLEAISLSSQYAFLKRYLYDQKKKRAVLLSYVDGTTEKAMLRVINIKKLLPLLTLRDGVCSFSVHDPVIAQNHASYQLEVSQGSSILKEKLPNSAVSFDIGEFAKIIAGKLPKTTPADIKNIFTEANTLLFEEY